MAFGDYPLHFDLLGIVGLTIALLLFGGILFVRASKDVVDAL